MDVAVIRCDKFVGDVAASLESFFWKCLDEFLSWLGSQFTERNNRFEQAAIQTVLELLAEFGAKHLASRKSREQLNLL